MNNKILDEIENCLCYGQRIMITKCKVNKDKISMSKHKVMKFFDALYLKIYVKFIVNAKYKTSISVYNTLDICFK